MTNSISVRLLFFFLVLPAFASGAVAADRGIVTVTRGVTDPTLQTEQRVALVIGNGAYESSPLQNPVNDARAMAEALRLLGFDVSERENISQKEMKQEMQLFGQKLLKGGVGLFYFAGHGVQVDGRNYLIPVGANIEHEKQVEYEAVDVAVVLKEMEHARNRLNIVVLDACRDNPFNRTSRSGAQGLASIDAPMGTLIAYATAPGAVASDGDGPGRNGPYTRALIRYMQMPGLKIEDVFKQVRSVVRQETGGKQIPWESSSLEGDFYFKLPEAEQSVSVDGSGTDDAAVERQAGGIATSRSPIKMWKEPSTGMEFVWIPGGCFEMGSPEGEQGRDPDEGPVHTECVEGFWMAKTEVTNEQYRKFQPGHDSKAYEGHSLNGDDQPVVFVTWDDAQGFVNWLKEQNGGQFKFRLPSEAEWEYACRAGTRTVRYWGDDSREACAHENVADEAGCRRWSWTEESHACNDGYPATAPVGSFGPNGFGLHDMLGNVWEWCQDVYNPEAYCEDQDNKPIYADASGESARVIRGGYWHGGPDGVRCADRGSGLPAGMNDDLGFRLVREP